MYSATLIISPKKPDMAVCLSHILYSGYLMILRGGEWHAFMKISVQDLERLMDYREFLYRHDEIRALISHRKAETHHA